MIEIFPSLISADLLNLQKEIETLEPYCAGFHLDIMDFHFVDNITWGFDFINQIRKFSKKQLQIHLMVQYPEKYLSRLILNQNDIISIHIESVSNIPVEEILYKIRDLNLMPSIAISPFTPLESLISLNFKLEHVLLMSVNPGFSGQKFMPHTINRLIALNNFRQTHNSYFKICVDGGINLDNYKILIQNGADQLAIASAIFDFKNRIEALKRFT